MADRNNGLDFLLGFVVGLVGACLYYAEELYDALTERWSRP